MDYSELEKRIGHVFSDKSLLETALTHASYSNERGGSNYERLEFLGDSLLGFISAECMFGHRPEIPEGRMTRLRSEKVCSRGLGEVGRQLGLGSFMKLSHGEAKSGGADRRSILEDMVEALIAAIYLDAGIGEAKAFVYRFILNDIDFSEVNTAADSKSLLQETLQKDGAADIRYELISQSGPDHDRSFVCAVLHEGEEIGRGSGKTKKEAEQNAAGKALQLIESLQR